MMTTAMLVRRYARKRARDRLNMLLTTGTSRMTRWRWAEPREGRRRPDAEPRGARQRGKGRQTSWRQDDDKRSAVRRRSSVVGPTCWGITWTSGTILEIAKVCRPLRLTPGRPAIRERSRASTAAQHLQGQGSRGKLCGSRQGGAGCGTMTGWLDALKLDVGDRLRAIDDRRDPGERRRGRSGRSCGCGFGTRVQGPGLACGRHRVATPPTDDSDPRHIVGREGGQHVEAAPR
jgi:hypothetical protein